MECTVRLDRPEKAAQEFVIQWISPGETRVRLDKAGEEIVRTFYPLKSERSVLELIAKSGREETAPGPRLEAELRPVENLLSSGRLQRLLDGKWQLRGTERRDGCDWTSFSVQNTPGATASSVTVDMCTFLPVSLERDTGPGEKLTAQFRWVPRIESRGSLFFRPVSRSGAETATPS